MSLDSIMAQIAVVEATVSGVKKAYANAPATLNAFPGFVNFPESGNFTRNPNARWTTHKIKMLLFVTKQVLPQAEATLRPYLESTLTAFDGALTLNSTAANSRIIGYSYGVLEYNGEQYLGITFDLEATEITTVDFTA